MEAHIVFQGKKDPPRMEDLGHIFIDGSRTESITFVCIEGGMVSGDPSVMIVSKSSNGAILLQTSLDKFLMAAHTMRTGAEYQWGWIPPEGYATLAPMDRETRKMMLEAIKQELEEWDNEIR